MAFVPYTLKKGQDFTRNNSNETTYVQGGSVVMRETTESETHIFHRFRITQDGSYWFHVLTIPKQVVVPVPADEPEDLGDEVPNCPMCGHHPMVRMSSDKGWRCGSPGNRWQHGRWSVCNGAIWDNAHSTPTPVATPIVPQEVVYSTPTSNGNGHTKEVEAMVNNTASAATKAIISIAKREGISLTTGEEMELEARRRQRVVEILSGEVYSVNYYIPDQLKNVVRNPSYIFRKYAYRLDGSNWVFSAKGLETRKVKEWMAFVDQMNPLTEETDIVQPHGGSVTIRVEVTAEYWVVQYTKEQRNVMREKAVRRLSQQLIKCHTSLITRMDKAAKAVAKAREKLGDKASHNAQTEVEQKHATRLRAVVTDACVSFEMALRGAEIYDDTGSLDAMFEAVRAVVASNAGGINALLSMRGMKQVKIPKAVSTPAINAHLSEDKRK